MTDNLTACILRLTHLLHMPVSADAITDELDTHPDYPSLLAVSDVLSYFNIDNGAYKIEFNDLSEVPVPFIMHTKLAETNFAVVESLDGNTAVLSTEKWKSKKIPASELQELYSGVVLAIDTDQIAARNKPLKSEPINWFKASNILKYSCIVVIIVSLLLAQTNFMATLTWPLAALIISKTAGLIACVLLLLQNIDHNNALVQALCGANEKKDCNNILSSKAANAFWGLTWSDVGFFYFSGTWLALLFTNRSLPILQSLLIINILSLPYTFYSIYYQARVAKKWCTLCCTVQALLWMEFISLSVYMQKPWEIAPVTAYLTFAAWLGLPVLAWTILKPLLLDHRQLVPLKNQLRKFKYNTTLFNASLQLEKKHVLPADEWSIVLGNVEANTIITVVSNPYCPPCSKAHLLLDEWLNYRQDIQVRFVFTASGSKSDIKAPVVRHLMALNALPDKQVVTNALHDWYAQKQKDYESWAKSYPATVNTKQDQQIYYQHEWCKAAEIMATPTILINGYKLPKAYQLDDIKYMLD